MASTTLDGVLLKGVAASRPAASAVAKGTIYSATDTGAITQSDGVSTWSTFATISSGAGTVTTVKDEGSNLSTAVVSLDFVGAGVTATGTTAVTVTIPGTGAMTLITDTLLGSDTASFDFTSIPGTYKHLEIIVTGRTTNGGSDTDFITCRLNNDSAANYDGFWMQIFNGFTTGSGNEDVAATSMAHLMLAPGATSTTGAVMNGKILIPDYASTTFHKSVSFSGFDVKAESTTNLRAQISGGIWHSTAAVTRVTLAGTGNWKTGSRASLYGIS